MFLLFATRLTMYTFKSFDDEILAAEYEYDHDGEQDIPQNNNERKFSYPV